VGLRFGQRMDAVLIRFNQDAEQFEEPTFLFGDFFFRLRGQAFGHVQQSLVFRLGPDDDGQSTA